MANLMTARKTIEEEEAEIKEMEEQHLSKVKEPVRKPTENSDEDDGDNEETLTDEEKSWKKRHGDLRRYSQEKEQKYQKELSELKEQIEELRQKSGGLSMPAKDEDIEAWKNKYPEVSSIIETLARKYADEKFEEAKVDLSSIKKDQEDLKREKDLRLIRKSHPDFDDLSAEDGFHDWVKDQPKSIQNALYENYDDPKGVIRVLDLYKADMGLTERDRKEEERSAAKSVSTKGHTKASGNTSNVKSYSESQVDNMTAEEFVKEEAAIMASQRAGTFIYDISGAVR